MTGMMFHSLEMREQEKKTDVAFVNTKRAFPTILAHIKFTCFFVSFTDHKFAFHGSLKVHVVVDECCCFELHLEKARSVP